MADSRRVPGGRRVRVFGVLAVLALAAQGYGLYRVTGPPTPVWFPGADKLEHAVGFAMPTGLVLLALAGRARARGARLTTRAAGWVLAAFAVHAVLSEVIQHLWYTTRTGDPFDVLADWTGTAVGGLAAMALAPRALLPRALSGRIRSRPR